MGFLGRLTCALLLGLAALGVGASPPRHPPTASAPTTSPCNCTCSCGLPTTTAVSVVPWHPHDSHNNSSHGGSHGGSKKKKQKQTPAPVPTPAPAPAPSKKKRKPPPPPAPAPAPPPADPSPVLPPAPYADVLERHNALRSLHSAPPLTWSAEIAQTADAWLAGCVYEHEPQRQFGENLYALWGSDNTTRALAGAVDAWYAEAAEYDWADPAFSERTGHFTAMVWRGSEEVGCAARACDGGVSLVACRYSPPGNVEGAFADNVLPPAAAA